MTPFAKTELALKKERILKALHEEERKKSLKEQGKDNKGRFKKKVEKIKVVSIHPTSDDHKIRDYKIHKTRSMIAKDAQVGTQTVKKVKRILDKAPKKTIEKARKGEISIDRAYREVILPPLKSR